MLQLYEDACLYKKMIQRLFAFVLLAGACSAYPHKHESTAVLLPGSLVNPENPVYPVKDDNEGGAINPEKGSDHSVLFPVDPVKGPVGPQKGTYNPEKGPVESDGTLFPAPNVPNEAPEDISIPEDGDKSDSDLKTDATFWWPYYRSHYHYPTYRSYSYWTYPTYYRYYTPSIYYSDYYW